MLSDDSGVFDPASLMQMMRRVHVSEDEMCEYVLDWPSVYGCPLPAATMFRGGGGALAAGLFAAASVAAQVTAATAAALAATVIIAAGIQAYRHRDWMALILPRVAANEQGSWRTLADVLLERGSRQSKRCEL